MKTVAVSWVSFNNDPYERLKDGSYLERAGEVVPGPALEWLFNPSSPVAGRVKRLYLFARRAKALEPGRRKVHPLESDVVEELRRVVKAKGGALDINVVWWDTDASPTDHRALFLFTARELSDIRRAHPNAEIVVNLSPGTPAAQMAMLVALQARIAGDRIRAFQGTPPSKRREPSDIVHEVSWNLLAELAATPTELEQGAASAPAWTIDRARSPRLREVAGLLSRYGSVPFPVLITGARGTGKTEIARRLREAFREWMTRAPSEWAFHLNCAEFQGDPTMLRSALFGYVRGAHSTAQRDQAGVLERAADDCVFLDEIHWMDPQAQGLLLVALQRGGSIRRIGGDKLIPPKFKLIAASNQSRDVLRNQLLPDFFDRIADLVIELPELRECQDDLLDIWKSVVRRACEELVQRDPTRAMGRGTRTSRFDDLTMEFVAHQGTIERAISSMRLSGNIRDLEKLARRLLVGGLANGRFLSIKAELVHAELERLRRDERTGAISQSVSLVDELPTIARCEQHLRAVRDAGTAFSASMTVEAWERHLLIAAQAVGGSGARAAALLGMNARTFNAKIGAMRSGDKGRTS